MLAELPKTAMKFIDTPWLLSAAELTAFHPLANIKGLTAIQKAPERKGELTRDRSHKKKDLAANAKWIKTSVWDLQRQPITTEDILAISKESCSKITTFFFLQYSEAETQTHRHRSKQQKTGCIRDPLSQALMHVSCTSEQHSASPLQVQKVKPSSPVNVGSWEAGHRLFLGLVSAEKQGLETESTAAAFMLFSERSRALVDTKKQGLPG